MNLTILGYTSKSNFKGEFRQKQLIFTKTLATNKQSIRECVVIFFLYLFCSFNLHLKKICVCFTMLLFYICTFLVVLKSLRMVPLAALGTYYMPFTNDSTNTSTDNFYMCAERCSSFTESKTWKKNFRGINFPKAAIIKLCTDQRATVHCTERQP